LATVPGQQWLWLDAFQSIPFQQVYHPATGGSPARMEYEAPPRFRARLEHNGTWAAPGSAPPSGVHNLDAEIGHWQQPPTQFDIWLYDGLVHYTFVGVYDRELSSTFLDGDVPPNRWDQRILSGMPGNGPPEWVESSFHDRPFTRNQMWDALQGNTQDLRTTAHIPYLNLYNPGFGAPYYGFCVKVEDANGHSVETKYADVHRFSVDDPLTTCLETAQDAQAKGQISTSSSNRGHDALDTSVRAPAIRRLQLGFSIRGQWDANQ
jgi:hypothetical protein